MPWELPTGPPLPTARQYLADTQDTLYRAPLPGDLGTAISAHFLPFHDCASPNEPPPALVYQPTAAQSVGETQETPCRAADVAPAGADGLYVVQVLPFQDAPSWWVSSPALP